MKTSGLDVHKDSIFCAIYDGKRFCGKRIFDNNGFDTFFERIFAVGKGKTGSNGKHLNLPGSNMGHPVGRWI